MTDKQFRALVDKLHRRTMAGELDWKSEDHEILYLQLPSGTVNLYTKDGEFESKDICIALYNKEMIQTDVFDDTMIEVRDGDNKLTVYPKMKEMYETAKRQVNGSDQVLKSILDDLD